MRDKVYFSDGTVEPILYYIIHTDYDVEFWTKDAHYHYISTIEDHPFLYRPANVIETFKYRRHYFYRIDHAAILVDISKIEVYFGKENETCK